MPRAKGKGKEGAAYRRAKSSRSSAAENRVNIQRVLRTRALEERVDDLEIRLRVLEHVLVKVYGEEALFTISGELADGKHPESSY